MHDYRLTLNAKIADNIILFFLIQGFQSDLVQSLSFNLFLFKKINNLKAFSSKD
jgi:hypothetical protein